MSQVNWLRISCLFAFLGFAVLSGCGSSSNSPSAIDPAVPGHPGSWLPAGHMAAAKADMTSCTECHGADLSGGISTVPCTQCHLGNAQSVHPLDWDDLVGTKHAGYVRINGNSSCSNVSCHGANLSGVMNSGPSCSSCHIGGPDSVHPQDWGQLTYLKHPDYVAHSGTSSCSNAVCHGPNLSGVMDSGPSCSSCHLGGPASVHPQDWGDLTYVRHRTYVVSNGTASCSNIVCHGASLTGVTGSGPSCSSCHLGGPRSVHPLDWADDFLKHAAYVNSFGTASCRNVVCHGTDLKGVSASGPSCFLCHQFALP